MVIFERINEEAKKKGWTIAKLERESGIANGAISGWKTSSPTLKKLEAVALTLGMTVCDLLKEEEK